MKSAILAVAALALLGGCTTQRGDGTTVSKEVDINIQTEPPGARCTVQRSGQVVATVEVTPQTATFERGIRAVTITCEKENYITAIRLVESQFSPGSVQTPPRTDYSAAGGIGYGIGLIIVAAAIRGSPANYIYPSPVYFTLESNSFPNIEARDAKYAELIAAVQERSKKNIDDMQKTCRDNLDLCRTAKRDAEKERDEELTRLEVFKQKAVIEPPKPAPTAAKKPATKS